MRSLMMVVSFFAFAAQAQSLAEKAAIKKANEKIAEYAEATNKTCGTELKFEIDTASIKGEDVKAAANFMWAATEAFDSICRNVEGGKEAVKAKITTIKMSKAGKHEFKIQGKTLAYQTTLEGGSADPRDKMVDWLKNNL